MKEGFWVSVVENEGGIHVTLHRTEKKALANLAGYCDEWWDSEIPDEEKPDDDEECILAYFERVEGERGQVTRVEVED